MTTNFPSAHLRQTKEPENYNNEIFRNDWLITTKKLCYRSANFVSCTLKDMAQNLFKTILQTSIYRNTIYILKVLHSVTNKFIIVRYCLLRVDICDFG